MGNYTRDTFDESKHYVGVRLQQGVPMVDADWNELEDIRRYEMRGMLRWFVGDGVPAGNQGFRIRQIEGVNDDFLIKGGDGTTDGAGRILVAGWEVLNESDVAYSAQGVAPLVPGQDAQTVYLDVWEREVGPDEDGNLVNPVIGEETCVRDKREWLVRVAPGEVIPDPPTGHVHYPLARLEWPEGVLDITDLRRSGLRVGSYLDMNQAISDAFGQDYTLDHDGEPNLEVSLRDAINALLVGGLPQPPARRLIGRAFFSDAVKDSNGDIWVFWMTDLADGFQLRYSRYRIVERALTAVAEGQVTDHLAWGFIDEGDDQGPSPHGATAFADRHGGVWIFWPSEAGGEVALRYRYHDGNAWSSDASVPGPMPPEGWTVQMASQAVAVETKEGTLWLFWQREYGVDVEESELRLCWNRFQKGAWEDGYHVPIQNDDNPESDTPPAAYVNEDGNIVLAWSAGLRLVSNTCEETNGAWEWGTQKLIDSVSYADGDFESIVASKDWFGLPSLIYSVKDIFEGNTVVSIAYAQYRDVDETWVKGYIAQTQAENGHPFPVFHSDGHIYVFWHIMTEDGVTLWYKRTSVPWTPVHSEWGNQWPLEGPPQHNGLPLAISGDEGNIWVVFINLDLEVMGPGFTDIANWHVGVKKLLMTI